MTKRKQHPANEWIALADELCGKADALHDALIRLEIEIDAEADAICSAWERLRAALEGLEMDSGAADIADLDWDPEPITDAIANARACMEMVAEAVRAMKNAQREAGAEGGKVRRRRAEQRKENARRDWNEYCAKRPQRETRQTRSAWAKANYGKGWRAIFEAIKDE